jgi:F-box/TPR repeat protein Pof3
MHSTIREQLSACRSAVAAEKYDEALDAVNSALRVVQKGKSGQQSDLFTVLDHRISVYIKKTDSKLALKDGKSMIRHDRKDGRGYIRCGQIERLLGNLDAAAKWYEQGLKHVPAEHNSVASLREQYASVRRRMVYMKPADPMTVLPLELVEMLVSYLDYIDVVAILRVSKAWTRILCSLPPLTHTIDYRRDDLGPISACSAKASIRRLKYPRTLILDHLSNPAATAFAKALHRWKGSPTLEYLSIDSRGFFLSTLPVSRFNLKSISLTALVWVDAPDVCRILSQCKEITSASFENVKPSPFLWSFSRCETLRELRIGADSKGVCYLELVSNGLEEEATRMPC